MIGSLARQQREATVIGAGISGLLAAHRLDTQGYRVTLLEASPRAGGLISTELTKFGIAESAAHSFLASSAVQELCRELQVPLVAVNPKSRARYILRNGRARRFPLTFFETAAVLGRVVFNRADVEEVTMDDWAIRHLGPAARDYLIAPFLLGIYASKPNEVSIDAAFPKLKLKPGQTLLAALLRGRGPKSKMMAPAAGMGALVSALEQNLIARLGSRFQRGKSVTTLPESPNVVLSVPADAAALLLRDHDERLARALESVEYLPMISVTVFVSRVALKMPLEGVGVLIPECERKRILGVLFNSSSFAGRVIDDGVCSFTVMLGGSAHREALELSDSELFRVLTEELDALFGLKSEPLHMQVNRWPRALPRYSSELLRTWQLAREGWCRQPGRLLFGNYTGQISIRGMIESLTTFG
jgi:oxygen-dependent protoporphyrinogen oxidase